MSRIKSPVLSIDLWASTELHGHRGIEVKTAQMGSVLVAQLGALALQLVEPLAESHFDIEVIKAMPFLRAFPEPHIDEICIKVIVSGFGFDVKIETVVVTRLVDGNIPADTVARVKQALSSKASECVGRFSAASSGVSHFIGLLKT